MNVYQKLQTVRVELQRKGLEKSGNNKFVGFKYFELSDFIPAMNELFIVHGLCSTVSFDVNLGTLTIIDADKPDRENSIIFTAPMSSAALKGAHDVQNEGAVISYIRRYLYMLALEIVEVDALDAGMGNESKISPAPKESTVKPPVANKPTPTAPVGNKSEPSGQTKIADAEQNPAVQEVKKAFPSAMVTDVKPPETPIGQPAEIADQIPGLVTPNQIDDIFRLIELAKLDKDRIGKILAFYKIKEFAELAEDKYTTLVKQLNTLIKK
ncbi:ERF family protein [Candidatus Dojkabacteria bacterium]|jgi:hypothetical protein|nr:ERF family protein [Candidatus Dojkabacteria bacterium]